MNPFSIESEPALDPAVPIVDAHHHLYDRLAEKFGGSRVVLVPAGPGTGVKAGPGVRDVLEACGIHNILTKTHGSTNPINLVKATIDGLLQLRTREDVVQLRGVTL